MHSDLKESIDELYVSASTHQTEGLMSKIHSDSINNSSSMVGKFRGTRLSAKTWHKTASLKWLDKAPTTKARRCRSVMFVYALM
jgi:hypothetical protein